MSANDERLMTRALQLAERGRYTTDPNPNVGCVLVKDGEVVGEGWHQWAGEPHAEIHALAAAGDKSHGATAYVTLEPCSHTGRTGPCCDALINAGVAEVVVAVEDPNPLVAGQGIARLRSEGVQVRSGVQMQRAVELNRGFFSRMQRQRPWIRVKMAMSLDGRTALHNGVSQWISGPEARADVQKLRAQASATLSGIGTVLADDPSLNVRLDAQALGGWGEQVRQPVRVILDAQGQLRDDMKLLALPGDIWIYTLQPQLSETLQTRCTVVSSFSAQAHRLDLPAVVADLAERGINELHLEAGMKMAGAFVAQGLVDELVLYVAPKLMGHTGFSLLHLPEFSAMSEVSNWRYQDVRQLGDDLKLTLSPE